MTWTWTIEGFGTTEQTVTVYNEDGKKVASETKSGWRWPSEKWPEWVGSVVAEHDFKALYMGQIERR